MQAMKAYDTYKSKTDWSEASKNLNAYQVSKNWTMKYSYATRVGFFANPDACDALGDPTLEFQVDGYGLGSLFGNFTFINRGCFAAKYIEVEGQQILIPDYPLEALRGVGTTAAGDQWEFLRKSNDEDPENSGYFLQIWEITGGSGRFENASGELWLYGNPELPEEPFVGGGTFIFDKGKLD